MNLVDLESSLQRPLCPICGVGHIRAIDKFRGKYLEFRCPTPGCKWIGYAPLPELNKKIIYLDTSNISHMANALLRDETDSPWILLHDQLRRAVAAEVICCPSSSIIEDEAELSPNSDQVEKIIRLSGVFGDIEFFPQNLIIEKQLFSALKRFLGEEPPIHYVPETRQEAFSKDPNHWLTVFNLRVKLSTPLEWLHSRQMTKTESREVLKRACQSYLKQGKQFKEILDIEASSFGQEIINLGIRPLKITLGLEPPDSFNRFDQNLFVKIFFYLLRELNLSYDDAFTKSVEFLLSDHVKIIPFANIQANLVAGIAMKSRGPKPRPIKSSDSYDINHISTYLPYVDTLVVDTFFADLCNQSNIRLGEKYGCEIRKLVPADIPLFIEDLDTLIRTSPHANLAARIAEAIDEGGFHQEFNEKIREQLENYRYTSDEEP